MALSNSSGLAASSLTSTPFQVLGLALASQWHKDAEQNDLVIYTLILKPSHIQYISYLSLLESSCGGI